MKKYLFLCVLFYSTISMAGFFKLTHHSSANCFNNASISSHFGNAYDFSVASVHTDKSIGAAKPHTICGTNGKGGTCASNTTWRESAVCLGEAPEPDMKLWTVLGTHSYYRKIGDKIENGIVESRATSCNIDVW